MWRTLLVVGLVACTEHGKGGGDAFDVTVNQLAVAACQNACVPFELQDNCIGNMFDDFSQARPQLGPAGEQACIACMDVKIQLFPDREGCMFSSAQTQMIEDACGLDQVSACGGASSPRF